MISSGRRVRDKSIIKLCGNCAAQRAIAAPVRSASFMAVHLIVHLIPNRCQRRASVADHTRHRRANKDAFFRSPRPPRTGSGLARPDRHLIERPARLHGFVLGPARFFISAGARAYRPGPTGLRGSERQARRTSRRRSRWPPSRFPRPNRPPLRD